MEINVTALQRAMMAKSFNVASLARAAGISAQSVNLCLRHGVRPRLDTLGKMARALGVDPFSLVLEEKEA